MLSVYAYYLMCSCVPFFLPTSKGEDFSLTAEGRLETSNTTCVLKTGILSLAALCKALMC